MFIGREKELLLLQQDYIGKAVIPDAFLPCRFHTGKQLHTCAAVPSHRFGKHLQPDAVCRRVPDLICGLQRR